MHLLPIEYEYNLQKVRTYFNFGLTMVSNVLIRISVTNVSASQALPTINSTVTISPIFLHKMVVFLNRQRSYRQYSIESVLE